MTKTNDTVFVYVHVPKCAGSTLDHHVIRHLPENEYWITKRRHWKRPIGKSAADFPRTRFLSGHFLGKSVEDHLAGRTLKRAVLLREPASFQLSYYNYRMMRYLNNGWTAYSIDTHVRSQPEDPITHFILSRWLEIPWLKLITMSPQEKYRRVNDELSRFWYVADYQCCDELCMLMSRSISIPENFERTNTSTGWQKRVAWSPLKQADLNAVQLALIQERTRIDMALWETWRNAGQDVTSVRPVPLTHGRRIFKTECARPFYAVQRRLRRGWF